MKKLTAIAVGLVIGASAWAQGLIDFNNTVGVAAKISEVGGSPFLQGSAYKVDLFYGTVGQDPSTFTSLGLAVDFNANASFAGFFAGGTQVIPTIPAGTPVVAQPRAWRASDGSSWAVANSTPGAHVSPATAPTVQINLVSSVGNPTPPIPSKLTGIIGHSMTIVPVPEPSTILLGLAGIGGLLFIRRKTA